MTRTIFAGGLVVDGTGFPGRVADVTVENRSIVSVDEASDTHSGAEVHDATGLVVAPGFIDVHSHADNAPLLTEPDVSKVLQGVTTEIVGNCGMSLAPRSTENAELLDTYLRRLFPETSWQGKDFADFLTSTDRAGYVVNYAPLVGHGTLRIAAMGFDPREPTAREQARMRDLLNEALDAGAIGFSTGLVYPPGRFAETPELIELARTLHGRPAIYTSHTRSEGTERIAAIQEAITIGREADVRVQISHHKAMGRAVWGGIRESLALVEQARADGVDVRFDVYPYTASSTTLTSCLPPDLAGLADDALLAELDRPETVARLREALARDDWDNHVQMCGGFDGILVSSTGDQRFEGRTLEQIAAERGTDGAEALVHVLVAERLRATMVCFGMDEADVETALGDRLTAIGSDGLPPGGRGMPHPRMWGTFPRVLGRYVRERNVLTLEDAVHRMTGLAADTFRLPGVGRIAPGYAADLVTFDAGEIADEATYTDPCRPPRGIREVMIGGVSVVAGTRFSGERAGHRIRSADDNERTQ